MTADDRGRPARACKERLDASARFLVRVGVMGAAPSDGLATPLDGLTVLVIEDHPDSRDALRQVLAAAGAEVVEAANGGRALDLLASARPDVILCDLLMPQVDGFDFIRRFRGDWPRTPVPVVAITALGEGLAILR